jgi:hypothetical protein
MHASGSSAVGDREKYPLRRWAGVEREGVGGHKMHIFTVDIPTFYARYRR